MLFGYRMQVISILGRGLIGLGYDSIDHYVPEIELVPKTYQIKMTYACGYFRKSPEELPGGL